MKMFWAIVLISYLVPEVTSKCPTLANTKGTTIVNITWSINLWVTTTAGECTASVVGVNDSLTNFTLGETKSIPAVNNDCIKFTCDPKLLSGRTFHYNHTESSCAYAGSGSQCSRQVKTGRACQEEYTCYSAVYDEIPEYTYTYYYKFRHGWFAMFSGYTCGMTGSGPCAADQCFNKLGDPRKEDANNKACLNVNDTVTTEEFQVYVCKEKSTCDSESYADLEFSHAVCNHAGQAVAEGTVTRSDACYHTVCVINSTTNLGSLVTSFKDHEGCVYGSQCVAVDSTVAGTDRYACAGLTCRKNDTLEKPYYLQVQQQTGCLYEGKCYEKNEQIQPNRTDTCNKLVCKYNSNDKTYHWDHKYSGCYQPPGDSCTHLNKKLYDEKCIKNKCISRNYGQWKTIYKNSEKCRLSSDSCKIDGVPGCTYKSTCHPVKTVITMDKCVQFVCYSSDKGLNSGTYTSGTPLPEWKARATGCYGPTGCMKLGMQYVDKRTNNTYRCDYNLKDWGIKMATFHKACVAPNGQTMRLGKSVYVAPVWYSCYRRGFMGVFDTSVKFVPATEKDNRTCGKVNGKWVLRYEPFYTPVGICKRNYRACIESCTFFDQPCEQTDVTPWRWLGDTYKDTEMNNAQCVCTQEYKVNNKNFTVSRFHTPALCSQKGVFNGACKDSSDESKHQWGEMWQRNGSDSLEVCTCHPLTRQPYCSDYLPDVNKVFNQMNIKKS